ncbi:MAG TPA: DEAD/DEAH box helicase [Ilumatobacter sp.]|nr:DEAD/DEAH box helicase [Ilumatobacter sp.]
MADVLLDALRTLTGRADAVFRDGQREAIEALVRDRSRVLVVQRTGWGKSAVYFLTTHLLRNEGLGPTLLISPLLALMRNQIAAAERLGLRCETINSASNTTVRDLEARLVADEVDLLLISPERLANPEFADRIMPLVGRRPGLIVIDEVHCISDWGHDFRPDYRRIGRIVDRLAGSKVPILGCTATANDRVVGDVADQLGAGLTTFRGPLRRDGLALSVQRLDRQAERLAWLAEAIPRFEGSGIVYCLTIRDVDNVAAWLSSCGLDVLAYSGATDDAERVRAEQMLQGNQVKALVATTALGMGYDKPDLGFVVHFQSPGSPVAYYQQVGRAGRALDHSRGVLLRGLEDEQIQDYFIDSAFAAEELVADVVRAFDSYDGPASLVRIQFDVNVKIGVLELIVKQLDVDGVLERVGGTSYQRTLAPFSYPHARVGEVTAARRAEQESMVAYLHTTGCRMRFVANLLDDPSADECGVCDNCTGASGQAEPLPEPLVAEAEAFLRRRPITLSARKMAYDADASTRRKIPAGELLSDGRTLAVWGDAGWGRLTREGKQHDGRFDQQLVDALAALVAEWSPDPFPTWVTAVPSLRAPALVADLAERVAAALGLAFHPVVHKVDERPQQRLQNNAVHQQLNIAGAFAVDGALPEGPCLLIDDLVDSGWTLTEVGRVLRRAGAAAVYPVALATVAGRE